MEIKLGGRHSLLLQIQVSSWHQTLPGRRGGRRRGNDERDSDDKPAEAAAGVGCFPEAKPPLAIRANSLKPSDHQQHASWATLPTVPVDGRRCLRVARWLVVGSDRFLWVTLGSSEKPGRAGGFARGLLGGCRCAAGCSPLDRHRNRQRGGLALGGEARLTLSPLPVSSISSQLWSIGRLMMTMSPFFTEISLSRAARKSRSTLANSFCRISAPSFSR